MRKLLFANLSRLFHSKAFWLTVFIMIVVESFLSILLLKQASLRSDTALFLTIQCIGILTSVFIGSFLGTEYSDGTLRNKLIVGHKRSSVYLASLLTGLTAITIIYFVWALAGGILIVILTASVKVDIVQLLLIGITGWLACLAYISIFNLVGMISSSKARTSIICILAAFFLFFIGLTCYSLAQPGLLSEFNREIFQFLFDFNPFGQTFQMLSIDKTALWKLVAYSLLLSTILTVVGLSVFRKKDLK